MTTQAETRAWRIADAAAGAWWKAGGGGNVEIPVSVIAALSLAITAVAPQSRAATADRIGGLSADDLAGFLSRVWSLFAVTRPELCIRTGPFARWLDEDVTPSLLNAAAATTRAAISTGELSAGDDTLFREADLLGCAYQALANPRRTKTRGEVYTSADVAELLMRIKLTDAHAGQVILDEGAGTGSLIRAAAQVLRDRGIDPRTMHWYACDTDPVAVAGLAVNACLWGLGPHVVIGCANILTEPDWPARARDEQIHALQEHDLRLSLARLLAAEQVIRAGQRPPGRSGTRL